MTRRTAFREMRPVTRRRAVLFRVVTALALLAVAEAGVRALGTTDPDGNFSIRHRWLRPHHLLLRSTEAALAEYAASDSSYLVYDAALGWTIRPNARRPDEECAANSLGIRSAPEEFPPEPRPGRLRIVVLGDSFTHGGGLPFEETWPRLLEKRLGAAGVAADVLNLGVPGYGFDQMYLRWKGLGRELAPHVVILGLCAGDAPRVVNVVRSILYLNTGIPFSKPRFVLESGGLKLVNSPTPAPEKLVECLRDFENSDLARWERHYDPAEHEDHVWLRSRLLGLTSEVLRPSERHERSRAFAPGTEAGDISLALIDALRKDVAAAGARFLVVHLPWRDDLGLLCKGKPLPYADALALVETEGRVVRPDAALVDEARRSSINGLFNATWHYGGISNRIVADCVADEILMAHPK